MIILQDFREKHGHHNEIEQYCNKRGVALQRCKLDVGDYMLPNGSISIDTKQNLEELANDLYQDKKAFNKKYKKCYYNKIKLIVLVEQEITSLSQIAKWKSPHTRISGALLYDMIQTLKVSYGVEFMFCKRENVGECIFRLLGIDK